MKTKEILLVGLPESGKTTFLAALWYLLQQDHIEKKMVLDKWPDAREYLNKLARKWTRFQPMARNLLTEDVKKVQLSLKTDEGIVDLHVPDMSGESWEVLWADRSCPTDFADLVKDARGVLLFIHADNICLPIDIMTVTKQVETVQSATPVEAKEGDDGTEEELKDAKPWDPKKSPTQVILVDLLQTLLSSPEMGRERRLAVIISAWDKVICMGQAPEQFLSSELPMLHQFLKYSGKYPILKVYGVSAQGGDLALPEDLQRLQRQDEPSDRIVVDDGGSQSYDLTLPIHWLISGEQ